MSEIELKPCPFCGEVPEVSALDYDCFEIICHCDMTPNTGVCGDRPIAVELWNRRALSAPPPTENVTLAKRLLCTAIGCEYGDTPVEMLAEVVFAHVATLRHDLAALRDRVAALSAPPPERRDGKSKLFVDKDLSCASCGSKILRVGGLRASHAQECAEPSPPATADQHLTESGQRLGAGLPATPPAQMKVYTRFQDLLDDGTVSNGNCLRWALVRYADVAPPPTEHDWFTFDGKPACRLCGVVRRADGQNGPCRGVLPEIGLRSAPQGEARSEYYFGAVDEWRVLFKRISVDGKLRDYGWVIEVHNGVEWKDIDNDDIAWEIARLAGLQAPKEGGE